MSVHDPLRFAAQDSEEEVQEEIPLDDEPPEPAHADIQAPVSTKPPENVLVLHSPGAATSAAKPSFSPPSSPALVPIDPLTASSHVENILNTDVASTASPLNGSAHMEDINIHQEEEDTYAHTSTTPSASQDRGFIRSDAFDAAGPSHRPQPNMIITVTDPVKRYGDHGFLPGVTSSHFEYLITSEMTTANGSTAGSTTTPSNFQVRRRFKDFVALAELLEATHRGYFVFPRPDKGVLEGAAAGRSEAEFVELRRSELENYLQRLVSHPAVGNSKALQVFLQAEGTLASSFQWQQLQPLRGSILEGISRLPRQLLGSEATVPSAIDVTKSARHTSDLLRRFREMGERVKQEYQPTHLLSDDEVKLREAKAGVEVYSESVAHASRRAERMLREFERLGIATGDVGLSLIRLAKYEDEEGSKCLPYSDISTAAKTVAADARRVGMAAVRMSRLARSATAEAVTALDPLHVELALAPAAAAALREREDALVTVDSIQEDLNKKQASLAAAEGGVAAGDANRARKAAVLRNDIAALEAALEAATAEYERVKKRNEDELARWKDERVGEYSRMLRRFAQVQALYHERSAQVWSAVHEDFIHESSGGVLGDA